VVSASSSRWTVRRPLSFQKIKAATWILHQFTELVTIPILQQGEVAAIVAIVTDSTGKAAQD